MIGEFLADYDVSLCQNINEGIASLNDEIYAMVICDARLPAGGTDRLIKFLNQSDCKHKIQLGLMTSAGQQSTPTVDHGLCYLNLEKPFTEHQLKGFIEEALVETYQVFIARRAVSSVKELGLQNT